jgi:hypothetical protein
LQHHQPIHHRGARESASLIADSMAAHRLGSDVLPSMATEFTPGNTGLAALRSPSSRQAFEAFRVSVRTLGARGSSHRMEDIIMNRATHPSAHLHRVAAYLYRVTHAAVLILGMISVLYLLSGRLETSAATGGDAPDSGAPVADGVAAGEESALAILSAPASMPASDDDALVPNQLSHEMTKVSGWVSRRYRVSTVLVEPALLAAEESGKQIGVDPLLLVAMMAVESSFNPFAESRVGAQGLMQIIPRFHLDKLGENASADALFDPALNVRVGAQVLHEGLRRYGNLQAALQYYGGASDDPSAAYARKVLTMKQRLAAAAGRKDETA